MRATEVPLPLLVIAARQEGLVSTAQCGAEGLGRHRRRRLVASGRARWATQRVLDLAELVDASVLTLHRGPDHTRRRAAYLGLLAYGQEAVSVGQCALALLGVQGLPTTIRAEVALPGGSARAGRAGIVVRRYRGSTPTVAVDGFRVTAPAWALVQAVADLDRGRAVAVLDSALHHRIVRSEDIDAVIEAARGRHGIARLRSLMPLVDGRAESPLETFARLQCLDAGVPPDDLQVAVRDLAGRVVARGDLGWRLRRGRWLIVEIDGAGPHTLPDAVFADRARQNAITSTGNVDLLRFTASDLARTGLVPAAVVAHRSQDELRYRERAATSPRLGAQMGAIPRSAGPSSARDRAHPGPWVATGARKRG